MIRLNIISRIDIDKNFFFNLLFVVYQLKEQGIEIKIKFIGKVYSDTIYRALKNNIEVLDIKNSIEFTERSIPVSEISPEENDYFVNFSVGNFVGYSSVQCLEKRFKTLFLNVDSKIEIGNEKITFCNNHFELVKLLKMIVESKEEKDKMICDENNKELLSFYLSDSEKMILKNLLRY